MSTRRDFLFGFDVLQLAVERAVGEKITPMMERMLLRPFGMARSGKDAFHLSPRMLEQMLTPHVRVEKFDTLSWGLGFGLQRPRSGPESFWHWGDWGIFQHYAVAYPADGSALVVMTNTNGLPACREVVSPALGREQPAFDWLMG